VTLNLLGLIYLNTERYEKAEPLLQEAMAIRTKIFPENHPSRSETLANLASLDSAMAHYAEAEARQREALKLAEARGPAQSLDIAMHSLQLADILTTRRQLDEAETLAR